MTKNQKLGSLLSVRQLPCFAHAAQSVDLIEIGHTSKTTATLRLIEILAPVSLWIKVTVHLHFGLPLTCSNRIGLLECRMWTSHQQQHVFAGQNPCAKTINQVQA